MTKIEKRIFEQDDYDTFMGHLRQYYERYKKLPTMDELRMFMGFKTFTTYVFGAEVFMRKPEVDLALIRNQFYEAYQTQQTMLLVDNINNRIEDKTLDVKELQGEMRNLVKITMPAEADYTSITPENYMAEYLRARDFRTTGISPLCFKNINRVTGGGIGVREILILIAPPSRGKTTYLVNELYTGLMNDEKVLYLSMENQKETIISRLSNRLLLMTKDKQRADEPYCAKFLKKFWTSVKEPVIMYRAAGSFTVDDLEMFIEDHYLRTGDHFDRIIVDYLNKFKRVKADRNSQGFDDERKLTDDFRAMIIRQNSRGITAAQTNRSGIVNREGTATESTHEGMIQGGFGQYETADMVLGYSETPNEQQRGEGRVTNLKTREDGGRGREFVVTMAPWIGLITDDVTTVIPSYLHEGMLKNPYRNEGIRTGLNATSETVKKKRIKKNNKEGNDAK